MADKAIKDDIKDQTTSYVTAALGLVAGLAWNDAIKSLIEAVFPFAATGIFAKFLYAIIITLVVVFISRSILRTSSSATMKK
ncbi:MAG: DUF5654 family protein [Candidatus Pacebacteria bacterium]|nr:DUF5654 family protein [Candidatus Paceibacterota bacterium]